MGGDCKIEIHASEREVRVTISGAISEDFDPSAIPADAGSPERKLTVNLAGVTRLNSSGVREWLRFVRGLTPGCFTLEACAVPFVQQLSMVFNMAPRSAVVSIYLPFFCDACRLENYVLVRSDEARRTSAENVACRKCGADTVFDDVPEVYFDWLGRDDA